MVPGGGEDEGCSNDNDEMLLSTVDEAESQPPAGEASTMQGVLKKSQHRKNRRLQIQQNPC